MGLDIYAGTLTRYYSHNWKTVVQQWAEENGYRFQRITPENGPISEEEEMTPEEIQEFVENWRDQLLDSLSYGNEEPYKGWEESMETPYYTDKPDWDAFGAMLLAAACGTYDMEIPSIIQKNRDFMEHPAVRRLAEDPEKMWSLFRGATWWIPLSEGFMFRGPLPAGDEAMIGTIGALRMELERINELMWQADEETILQWTETEGYPQDGQVTDGVLEMQEENTWYDTQSLAKFAFSIFYRALLFSEKYQVPILMDF